MVWGLPRCVWARESTAPAQGNQSLSRESGQVLCAHLYQGKIIIIKPGQGYYPCGREGSRHRDLRKAGAKYLVNKETAVWTRGKPESSAEVGHGACQGRKR